MRLIFFQILLVSSYPDVWVVQLSVQAEMKKWIVLTCFSLGPGVFGFLSFWLIL